jgi:predicted nucleotidyltransferase
MKRELQTFQDFLNEAVDPNYYQETFYFTMLISMTKEAGGSRDETKNDIRALPEVLTVTLVEREKGGVQKDLGTKFMSTLKIHVRKPRDISKEVMMKRVVKQTARFKGVSVLRYKEKAPKQRRKAFRGAGSYVKRVQSVLEGKRGYQQNPARKRRLRIGFKRLTQTGPNNSGPFKKVRMHPSWKSAPPGAPGGLEETQPDEVMVGPDLTRFDHLYEDVVIRLGGDADIDKLMAFDVQPQLQQKIWNGEDSVRPGVRAALMDIVEEFLEGLDLDVEIKDVIVTGSIANYNWSKFSDIDVHILIDFKEVNDNEEMVKRFFDSVRSNWNKLHNIHVKGHEVEIYIQAEHEPHISTGVYSLIDERWLVKPKKIRPAIDRATATKKMRYMAREIDKLSAVYDTGDHEGAFDMAERIKNKLKKMRLGGLARSGIYSPENLAFKMLRRSGDIEQLFSIYTQAYDKIYSLDQ